MSYLSDEDLDWLREGGHHGPKIEEGEEPRAEESYVHIPGGSDSRANWVSEEELKDSGNFKGGCLTMIVLGAGFLGSASYGIYELTRYFYS